MHSNRSENKQEGIFVYLFLLTSFFLLLEISFFILCNKAYLSDFTFVAGELKMPMSIVPDALFFLSAQLALHLIYCLLVWFTARFAAILFRLAPNATFNLALILWFTGIGAIFALNQYYYPNSKFTQLSSIFLLNQTLAWAVAWVLTTGWLIALLSAMIGFIAWLYDKSFGYTLLLMLFLAIGSLASSNQRHSPLIQPNKQSQPNIIIIGMDSIRPDFLGYFGRDHTTPFIDSMLLQSSVFSEAVTPLARTFPSWTSVLMGQYPRESGVRFNLADVSHVNLSNSMPAILKQQGYETIYATDETRFSNIDHNFGFTDVITPPMGLNDFLLGSFNDFPLSNLVLNTPLGRWLFPYSYANRSAFATYDPDSFIELMRPALQKSRQQPLFITVHFCLPHHPYLWASLPGLQLRPQERYQASIARMDKQLQSFFTLLDDSRLLDHAIVVLLSDHGEALEFAGDRITQRDMYLGVRDKTGEPPHFYPQSLDEEAMNQSAGHGTDVLGLPQYHTLLAFKLYGMGQQHVGEITGVVPLVDIKQAILELTGMVKSNAAHAPLAAMVRGKSTSLPLRHVFTESDYSPAAMHTVYPETRKVLLEGIQLFHVDPISARLTVKNTMGEMMIRSKQYADIYGSWMLAFYPQNNKYHMPVLINLKTGQWTNDLHSSFARHSPVIDMQTKLKHFYGLELKDQ